MARAAGGLMSCGSPRCGRSSVPGCRPRPPAWWRSAYFFPDLAGVSGGDEQAAIDAGEIQANRIAYVGRRR
jgi:hypothetical protein